MINRYLDKTDTFMATVNAEVYRVGGSVRDEILGRKVKDADYMVRGMGLSDLGAALRSAGRNIERFSVSKLSLRDGRQYGWRASGRGLGLIEVMLPRTEVPRTPEPGENVHRAFDIVVDPKLSLEDDAKRRDFTFNALYKHIDTVTAFTQDAEVIDPTGRGVRDLKHKLINVTHADSFRDDPLRTLRALRFISTLDYELGVETYILMQMHAGEVTGLSAKGYASGTLRDELIKLLMGAVPAKALRIARDTGVLGKAIPQLAAMIDFDQGSRYHDMTTDEHTFTALETAAHVDAPLPVRLALLFHDSGKPETAWMGFDGRLHYYEPSDEAWAKNVANSSMHPAEPKPIDHEVAGARLWDEFSEFANVPKKLRDDVRTLILNHMVPCQKVDPVRVRRERVRLGDEMLHNLLLMRMCDLSGKGNKNAQFLLNVAEMEKLRAEAEVAEVPASPRDLRINGDDLLELGVEPGRVMGDVLRTVLDEVVCQPKFADDREWQLRRAGRLGGL
jgi:tRNA nucleotidyltransferase (CCA-adding enzyme)